MSIKVVYVPELPVDVIIKTKKCLLVGTGQKGDVELERLCSQEGK